MAGLCVSIYIGFQVVKRAAAAVARRFAQNVFNEQQQGDEETKHKKKIYILQPI